MYYQGRRLLMTSIMKDKLLFVKTYKSKRSNGINRAYWTKFVKNIPDVGEFLPSTSIDPFNDIMPIFSCLVKNKKRGVVIYQYNPSLISPEEMSYTKYITAWISQRKFQEQKISILTICLIPSRKNMETSKELIISWLMKCKNVRKLINKIYESQNGLNE